MITKKTKKDRDRILECLAEAHADGIPFLWIREVARRTGINLGTVIWVMDRYLYPKYVEYPGAESLIERGLRIKPIKLKDSVFNRMTSETGPTKPI